VSAPYAAAFFVLCGGLLRAAGHAKGAVGALLVYGAVAAGLVGLGYATGRADLLGKSPAGKRSLIAMLLVLPYLVINALLWELVIRISSEPPVGEAVPGLFFGRRLTARRPDQTLLPEHLSILDLTAEFLECSPWIRQPGYVCLPLLDGTAASLDQIRQAVCWIEQARTANPVYVHCALGHGRTGTILACYLLHCGVEASPDAALARLRRVRPRLRLNRAQSRRVAEFWRLKDASL